MSEAFSDEYVGQRLFHFWREMPFERAFRAFVSIVERGFLLSRATTGLIDRFVYETKERATDAIEVVQNARICFTDIPEDKLHWMSSRYGRCGLGFSRQQIVAWGGLPVWYLPNHFHDGAVTDSAASFLYWIGEALHLIDVVPALLDQTGASLTRNGQAVRTQQTREETALMHSSILRVWSFLKEMSGKACDDHRYLYEREWRIVSGCVSSRVGALCRKLTSKEKEELLNSRPDWGSPMEANDPRVTEQLSGEPLIDSFWFFNGIPGKETVSQAIEAVLVPDRRFSNAVEEYVARCPEKFRAGGPEVHITD